MTYYAKLSFVLQIIVFCLVLIGVAPFTIGLFSILLLSIVTDYLFVWLLVLLTLISSGNWLVGLSLLVSILVFILLIEFVIKPRLTSKTYSKPTYTLYDH